jgi:hypothetical protein
MGMACAAASFMLLVPSRAHAQLGPDRHDAAGGSTENKSVARASERDPDRLGCCICPLNDVDGDGRNDFVLDDGSGSLWLVSGKTGKVLKMEHLPSGTCEQIVPLYGDVNADGAFDFVLSRRTGNSHETAEIRSGKTLEALSTLGIEHKACAIGWHGRFSIAGVGDWNGDGVPDVAAMGMKSGQAVVFICSGKDGHALGNLASGAKWSGKEPSLWMIAASQPDAKHPRGLVAAFHAHHRSIYAEIGDTELWSCRETNPDSTPVIPDLHFIGDLDGDGVPEVVRNVGDTPQELHRTLLVSGRDGRELGELKSARGVVDGLATARLPDINGDGVDDFIVGFPGIPMGATVLVYSGKDLSVIRTHEEDENTCIESGCTFGVAVASLGRIDDDAVGDYAIGSSGGQDFLYPGCVAVYSGATGKRLYVLWKKDLGR